MPRKWVLVVDDEPSVRSLLESALNHPELCVTTAADAEQGYIQAKELKPVVVVCDINMPGLSDGRSVYTRLRADPSLPRMPVVFMTGMPMAEARKLLPKDDSSIGVLPKPLDIPRLREFVWKVAGVDPAAAPGGGQ